MATDVIAFDDAVRVAVEFAEEDGDTLVMAMPDHNCGGLTIANYVNEYADMAVESLLEPLKKMKMTVGGVLLSMGVLPNEATADDLFKSVAENWGVELTDEELTMILEYSDTFSSKYQSSPYEPIPLGSGLSRVFSDRYTVAGWTSHGHTGGQGKFLDLSLCCLQHHPLCASRLELNVILLHSSNLVLRHGSSQESDGKCRCCSYCRSGDRSGPC
jgi:alkaline phosphatase